MSRIVALYATGQLSVSVLDHQLVSLPGHPLTQQRELRADGEGGTRQRRWPYRPKARHGAGVRLAVAIRGNATLLPEFRFHLSVVGA